MGLSRTFFCGFLFAILSFFFLSTSWAAIGVPSVSPPIIPTAQDVPVTVSAYIPDVKLIPTSVNLLRVNSSGKTTILGSLNDQGLNGDAEARDKIFTATTSFNESIGTSINLRISAALKGTLKRITRDIQVPVVDVPIIQDYTQYNQTIDDIFSKLVDTRNNFLAANDANTAPTQFFDYLQTTETNLTSVYASLYAIYRFETHSPSNYPKAAEYAPVLGSLIGKANEAITERDKFIENGLDPDVAQIASWAVSSECLTESDLSGESARGIREVCAYENQIHNLNSKYNSEVLPEAGRIAVKESTGQYTNLTGGGIGDLFGGTMGKIIGKGINWSIGKILDIFISESGDGMGMTVAEASNDEEIDVPAGMHDVLASSTVDNTRAIACNVPVTQNNTFTVSMMPDEVKFADEAINETFESLSIGPIDGQGNWTVPSLFFSGSSEVVSSPTHSGNRSLHLSGFGSNATYTTNSTTSTKKTVSFWYREQYGFGTNDTGNNMSLRNAIILFDGYHQHTTYVNICHAGTGHRSVLMTADAIGNGCCVNGVGDMTEGNWYFIEVEYDFGNRTAHARVDGGDWGSNINLRVYGGANGNYITSFSSMSIWDNPPEFWFDDFGQTSIP